MSTFAASIRDVALPTSRAAGSAADQHPGQAAYNRAPTYAG
jgi:hypothetical protein